MLRQSVYLLALALAAGYCRAGDTVTEPANGPWSATGHTGSASPAKSLDLQQRILLDTIFPLSGPLIIHPSARHAAAPAESSHAENRPLSPPPELRTAIRPDGIAGWRPANPATTSPPATSPTIPDGGTTQSENELHENGPHREPPTGSRPSIGQVDDDRSANTPTEPASPANSTLNEFFTTPSGVHFRAPRLGRSGANAAEGTNAPAATADDLPGTGQEQSQVSIVPEPTVAGGPSLGLPDSAETTPLPADPPSTSSAATEVEIDTDDHGRLESSGSAAIESDSYGPTDDAGLNDSEIPESVDEDDEGADVPLIDAPLELDPHVVGGATQPDTAQPAPTISSSPPSQANAQPPLRELPPAKPLPPLTRQLMNMRSRIRSVLNGYYRKPLNTRENDPWEAMHGMLAYETQSRIRQGGPRGDLITSVGWLCYNKPCKGQTLLHVTREGELRAKYGVGLQGHLGQLLAMLAQCHVSPDYPIRVGQNQFTVRDLIEAEKKTCYPKSELTFKLLAFQYYLDTNETWFNDQGEEWSFPRLIQEELAQPMRTAACGGTHRLSSLSLTLKARLRRGEPIDGEYARAAEFVKKHHQYAFRLQNRDGSLSTAWFNGRGDEDDPNRRIKTTGHMLEWLCYSLSDEELRDPRMMRAVSYLANLMYTDYDEEWEIGPICHATHALLLYDERVFMPYDRAGYTAAYRPRRATALRTTPSAGRR